MAESFAHHHRRRLGIFQRGEASFSYLWKRCCVIIDSPRLLLSWNYLKFEIESVVIKLIILSPSPTSYHRRAGVCQHFSGNLWVLRILFAKRVRRRKIIAKCFSSKVYLERTEAKKVKDTFSCWFMNLLLYVTFQFTAIRKEFDVMIPLLSHSTVAFPFLFLLLHRLVHPRQRRSSGELGQVNKSYCFVVVSNSNKRPTVGALLLNFPFLKSNYHRPLLVQSSNNGSNQCAKWKAIWTVEGGILNLFKSKISALSSAASPSEDRIFRRQRNYWYLLDRMSLSR